MWHFIKRSIFTAIPISGLRGDRGTVEYSPFFLPLFLQLETIIKHRVLTRDPCGNLSFLFLSPHPLLPVEQEIYFRSALDSNHSCVDLKRFSAEVFPSCFTFQKFFKKNQEIDE